MSKIEDIQRELEQIEAKLDELRRIEGGHKTRDFWVSKIRYWQITRELREREVVL